MRTWSYPYQFGPNKVDYEIRDESYEDEYGCLKTNYTAWVSTNGRPWTRLTTTHYLLSRSEAERQLPHRIDKCPTCGHQTTHRIPSQNE